MTDTPESLAFDAKIGAKTWRIVVSRELVEDELQAHNIPRGDMEEFVDEHSAWLTNLATQKLAREPTEGDTIVLVSDDRGRP